MNDDCISNLKLKLKCTINNVVSRAYVCTLDKVLVIDIATNDVIGELETNNDDDPTEIAITPDDSRAYVTNSVKNTITVIDIKENKVIDSISIFDGKDREPWGIAIIQKGSRAYAYVTNYGAKGDDDGSNKVAVIDIEDDNKIIANIPVGDKPPQIAITPDGSLAYVTSYDSNRVSVIDTTKNEVIERIDVGGESWGVTITPDGSLAYVTIYYKDEVKIINTANNSIIETIKIGDGSKQGPMEIAIMPDSSLAYVTNYESGTVSVIDMKDDNKVIDTIHVGKGLWPIEITPDGSRAYVGNWLGMSVSVIDTKKNEVIYTISNDVREPIGITIRYVKI